MMLTTSSDNRTLMMAVRQTPSHAPILTPWSQGVPLATQYSAIFPPDFAQAIADGFMGLPNNTTRTIYTSIQLMQSDGTYSNQAITIMPGEIFVLSQIWQSYQSKQINAQTWEINFTDQFGRRMRLDFTTEDLKSLFSVVDYAIAGGTPGSLEGEVTLISIDDQNRYDSDAGATGDPVGVYD